MKIAMVGYINPHINGLSSHVYALSRKLISKGHEVFIVSYPHKEGLKDIDGIHVSGAKIIDIPLIRPLTFKISAKKILTRIVEKENIDIIHGHTLIPTGLVAVEVAKKYNIPSYVTAHGPDMYELYKNPFWRKIINKVLNGADNVLAVSNNLMNEILNTNIKNIQNKTSIHLNSVDINKFKETPHKNKKEKPTVIFVGWLSDRKNVNLLLDAKKQSQLDYKLIYVGDGPLTNKLKYRAKNENIKDVKFLGFRKDIENILPNADLLVLPSFSEAFGIVLIEALACGLPVIGSNIGGINEIITPNTGLLIDPYDVSSLTHAIDKLLNDKKLYNKLKSHARKKAMEFAEMKIPYTELK